MHIFCVGIVGGVSFGLTYSIVHSAEGLCEGKLCCLGHRRKVSAMCLLYGINHRVNHQMNEYLKPFVSAHNTRAAVSWLCDPALKN